MKLLAQTFALTFAFMLVTYAASAIINGGFPLPPPIPKGSPIAGHPSYPSAAGNPRLGVQYIWINNSQWTVYWINDKGQMQFKRVSAGTGWAYMTGHETLPQ